MTTPRTGARCSCRVGEMRDNCPTCEGTGWVIDFARIHRERREHEMHGGAAGSFRSEGCALCPEECTGAEVPA